MNCFSMLYSREVCDFGFSDVLSEKVLHLNLTVKKVCLYDIRTYYIYNVVTIT